MAKYKKWLLDDDKEVDFQDADAVQMDGGEVKDTVVSYDKESDSDEITCWSDFLANFMSGTRLGRWFKDFRAGCEFLLDVGKLVNNCTTDDPESPLSAAQGKVLMDLINTANTNIAANTSSITELNSALNNKADTSALTNGSVTKVGTSTVGGTAKGIYLNSGTPTACSSTVGSGTQPTYLSSGTVTACNTTVGSSVQPVYMSSGTITAGTSLSALAKLVTFRGSCTISATSSYQFDLTTSDDISGYTTCGIITVFTGSGVVTPYFIKTHGGVVNLGLRNTSSSSVSIEPYVYALAIKTSFFG